MRREVDSNAPDGHEAAAPSWASSAATGAAYCYATTFLVFIGVALGAAFVDLCTVHAKAKRLGVLASFAAWDGQWYAAIASEGYSYDPARESSVAFFPAFPLAGRWLATITGMRAEMALFVVSQTFLLASFVIAAEYCRQRFAGRQDLTDVALLSLGVFPTMFYFRMAYSESMFLFLTLLALLGIERRWPAPWVAGIIGLATATRPMGIALLAPFAMHLWQIGRQRAGKAIDPQSGVSRGSFLLATAVFARAMLLILLSCWGILAYMAYQWWTFSEPLAFVKTQAHWGHSIGEVSFLEHASRLVTLAPIRAVYEPGSPCYWGKYPPRDSALFNMMFANPIYFLVAVGLVALGARKRWLNGKEVALSIGLLLIPYVTQGDRTCMASQARFASVVFPMYLVLAQIMVRLPGPVVALLAALSAVMLALYTALFVNWYWFY